MRVFNAAEFNYFRDISASKLQQTISGLKKIVFQKDEKNNGKLKPVEIGELSQRTRHHILTACKSFCRWMVVDGRASHNPIEHIKPVKVVNVAQRAALEQDELRRLLSYTEASKAAYNLEGYQRAILYRFAAQTGFRASEIAALKVGDIDLKAGRVILSGEHTKNRQDAIIPLRPELTERLKEILRGKMPQLQAFKMPALDSLAKMFRKDIAGADIKIKPDRGLVDFHCLQHTFGTHLAAAGVHPKTAQTLMRHSNINLTMSRYTHILLGQESTAINNLPNLDSKETEKTGTENE